MINQLLILLCLLLATPALSAQERKVTPVESDEEAPLKPTLHYFDKSGNPLDEPVYLFSELDTVQKVKSGPVYPAYNGLSIGVNFIDGVMQLTGQEHQSYDVAVDVSIWNWLFPVVEAGVGFADSHPDGSNYRYKGLPSLYTKIGLNYNFLYKSSPDYQVFVGFRAGYSAFRYDITDVNISSGYWKEDNIFDIPRQHASCFFGEALAGLKVKIAGNFYLGWNFRYRFKFKERNGANSAPWFIPGYGASSPFGFTFSAIWNIPVSTRRTAE